MLRISETQPLNHSITLRLEGRIMGPWVEEARRACERILTEGQTLQLDLAEVDYLDANGAVLLASLRARGVRFVTCSPFVEARLTAAREETG
jgi:anti-anti-sigma regulatory factor